jgi:hypothetical protein
VLGARCVLRCPNAQPAPNGSRQAARRKLQQALALALIGTLQPACSGNGEGSSANSAPAGNAGPLRAFEAAGRDLQLASFAA